MTDRGTELLQGESPFDWQLNVVTDKVKFSDKAGPWMLLCKNNVLLWVNVNDENFMVIDTSN